MAKLLLINPSYYRTYGSNEGGLGNPIYPVLSLACLAATARAAGHEVKIVDLSFRRYEPDMIRELFRTEKPDVVGITATTPLANQMRDISYIAKEVSPSIVTIGGGPHASALPQETLRQSALDMVAFGEGDWTIVDVMNGMPRASIKGIVWRDGDEIITNEHRELIHDINDLPIPAWDLYPFEDYLKHTSRIIAKRLPVSTIEFSRGCVFQCDFCASKNTMGMGYRKKTPSRCADEMLFLQKLGYREVVLADDIFTSDHNWATAVCDEFIRRGVKMAWTCTNGIRVDSAKDELFEKMRAAGCYRVHFGFESGNDEVLKAFGKGGKASLDQGVTAATQARRAGMDTFGMFMLGLSGDTEESMQDTINYARRVAVDAMHFGITVPFPGTKMFDKLHRAGKIKSYDWDIFTVYNNAFQIYEHPNLSWELINKYFRKAHIEAYFQNPGYIWRRFVKGVKTGEFFWDVYYFFKFLTLMRGQRKTAEKETYAYADTWGALGVVKESIKYFPPPIAGSGASWKDKAPRAPVAVSSGAAE